MIAARRSRWNFALQHAIARARELRVGLVVLEGLRVDYRWSSPRLHRFVVEGMAANARAFAASPVRYVPYVEPSVGAGRGLLEALAADACVVVTDHFPSFFLPRMVSAAAARLPVRLEVVDGNGLLPLSATDRPFPTAMAFRWHLQRTLPQHLGEAPVAEPLAGLELPPATLPSLDRWPTPAADLLAAPAGVDRLPLLHRVPSVSSVGGAEEAARRLDRFLDRGLSDYEEGRRHPDREGGTGLSAYLHFGHVSSHEIVHRVLERSTWTPDRLGKPNGRKEGWWNAGSSEEAFLDQVITWRELGFVYAEHRPDHDRYEANPDWARASLAAHASDRREWVYPLEVLDGAGTHDPIWNAAQRELVATGVMHNYLRMLWGKKVLEWSASPEAAFDVLVELNNRYALDGRNPNTYSGVGWVFGRFDRPWGPERPIYGNIRYMTSDATRRKLDLEGWLERWS